MAKVSQANVSFTAREMKAIAAMLLSQDGINVDPIITDLYGDQLTDEAKSVFRCKLALMLRGNLPEFQHRRGYKRTGSRTVYLYEIIGESSLLGVYHVQKVAKYTREEVDGKEDWKEAQMDSYDKSTVETQSFDFVLHDTLGDAIENW